MDKILYLPIETIAREFDARMLLAHQALSRDYVVIVGPKNYVLKAADTLKSGIYFYKSHGAKDFPKKKVLNEKCFFKYVSLDEEGLVFVDDDEYLRKSKPFELEHLDVVFTWGSVQKNLLLNKNPELKSKVIEIGNPRFDLLRPEFQNLYQSAVDKIKRKWGNYILINTRFAQGNFSRLYGCSYVEARIHQFYTIIGRSPTKEEVDFLIAEEKYYKKLFQQYIEMIACIASKFPEINFVERPHPSEDHLSWQEALKGLENVHVIFEGSAIEWIIGSMAIIHTGCTTGIESWALKKFTIVYNPNNEKGIEPPLPNKFGVRVSSIKELYKLLFDIINRKVNFNIDKQQFKIAKSYIESIDGDYSVTRFLNILDERFFNKNNIEDEILKNQNHQKIYSKLKNIESFKSFIKIIILKFLSKYQSKIRKFLGKRLSDYIYNYFKKYPGLFAQFQKFPILKLKDIKLRLFVFDKIFYKENKENNYNIKKIATDTYLLSRK